MQTDLQLKKKSFWLSLIQLWKTVSHISFLNIYITYLYYI